MKWIKRLGTPKALVQGPVVDAQYVRTTLEELGVPQLYERFMNAAAPCVRFSLGLIDNDSEVTEGCWLGGAPDLPGDLSWPLDSQGSHLPFIAQFDFAEVAAVADLTPFPHQGRLWIFGHGDGDDRVLFHRSPDTVRAFPDDVAAKERYRKRPLTPYAALSFLDSLPLLDELALSERDQERIAQRFVSDDASVQIGGFHSGIQSEDVPPEMKARAPILLAQIPMDAEIGMRWGDGGRIYLWIAAADLSAEIFDSVLVTAEMY